MRIAFLDDVICANHIVQAVLMMSKPSDHSEFQALVLFSLMHMGAPPRLIDFRHTFASNVLLMGPEGRDHIGRHILALTTYLGHAHVGSTYWYLESSPQLMNDIAQACERLIKEKTR